MTSGAAYLRRGFALWRTRPGLMMFGAIPALVVLAGLVSGLVVLVLNLGDLVAGLTPFAEGLPDVARAVVRFLLGALLLYAGVMLATVSFTGLTLVVGDPFYERIWKETEKMLTGSVPDHDVSFWVSLADTIRLIAIGLLTTVAVVLIGLLPILGAGAALMIGVVASGRLLAAELLGRPLAARGMDRAARGELLRSHRNPVLGFGAATQMLFLIPLGAVVAMPAAVVGATMLAHDLTTAGVVSPPGRRGPGGS